MKITQETPVAENIPPPPTYIETRLPARYTPRRLNGAPIVLRRCVDDGHFSLGVATPQVYSPQILEAEIRTWYSWRQDTMNGHAEVCAFAPPDEAVIHQAVEQFGTPDRRPAREQYFTLVRKQLKSDRLAHRGYQNVSVWTTGVRRGDHRLEATLQAVGTRYIAPRGYTFTIPSGRLWMAITTLAVEHALRQPDMPPLPAIAEIPPQL